MSEGSLSEKCPVCDELVVVPVDIYENEIVDCGTCGTELEVVGLDPLTFEEAPETQEDWGE